MDRLQVIVLLVTKIIILILLIQHIVTKALAKNAITHGSIYFNFLIVLKMHLVMSVYKKQIKIAHYAMHSFSVY